MRRFIRFIDRQLEVDARSLAVGRVAIGVLLLWDIGSRAQDLVAHYSDEGAVPRALFRMQDWSFVWSLHSLSGAPWFEAILFGAAGCAALALSLGSWTRTATAVSFLLALSIQGRNPLLHDGQDDWMRMVLFFSLWLPLGRVWSIDARAGSGRHLTPQMRVSGIWAAGLVGQLVLMYESSFIGKLQSAWWRSGEGIEKALLLSRYETHAGRWLAQAIPGPLHSLSYSVMALEAALPLLLFIPSSRMNVRLLSVCLGLSLHLGFWIFMRLGIFPPLCIATWILLLPSSVWDGSTQAAPPADQPDRRIKWPFVAAMVALCFGLLYVVGTHRDRPILPEVARRVVEGLGLQQYWVVFSPRRAELVTDGYFVAPVLLSDGTQVDLFADDGPVTYARPELVSSTFRNRRWRHFYANLVVEWLRGSEQWRQILAIRQSTMRFLCRDYEVRHPGGSKPTRTSLYFVEHSVDHPESGERRRLVAQVSCD